MWAFHRMAVLWLAGCAGDATDGGHTDAETPRPIVVDLAPCGFVDPPAGTIDVSQQTDVFHAEAFARVDGVIHDAADPTFHAVVSEDGACRALSFEPAFCDPTCAGGEVCQVDATCAPYPAGRDGGTLTLDGLSALVTLEGADWSPGTYIGPADLPVPLFEPGEPVGAWLDGLGLSFGAVGVSPMDDDLTRDGLVLVDGLDTTVDWTPSGDPDACVQLVLNGSSVSHGAPIQDLIVCETTDSGSLVVPASLLATYPYGETPEVTEGYDWPHSTLTRYTRSRVDAGDGPIELSVRSTTSFRPTHPMP